eukprot:TRINITY_DN2522_c0_g1_i21.p2 TRINITY_DN2522_c0_g1~~TRINITY_DN2522_c0_g1_i21.p2  ORF type:complete len:207 (+),score=37.38 TRINITY_DN2522_c0_g1_i21:423-1043(+)
MHFDLDSEIFRFVRPVKKPKYKSDSSQFSESEFMNSTKDCYVKIKILFERDVEQSVWGEEFGGSFFPPSKLTNPFEAGTGMNSPPPSPRHVKIPDGSSGEEKGGSTTNSTFFYTCQELIYVQFPSSNYFFTCSKIGKFQNWSTSCMEKWNFHSVTIPTSLWRVRPILRKNIIENFQIIISLWFFSPFWKFLLFFICLKTLRPLLPT